jgi:NhaP-type Na+/H+ or K+/H+ antiporter
VAILLGAILAPTDPVLAGDVQVRDAADRDRVRFSLTSEAGLNDGTAFPFVMLGLGIVGLHEIGDWGWRWIAVDLLWAVPAGLGVGALLGTLVGRLVIHLRHTRKEAVGLDDFLALGLIALAYGCALAIASYGFLAVFAAGLAVRRIEARSSGDAVPRDVRSAAAIGHREVATDPETAPAYMTEAVLAFNEQIDRIGAMAIMLLVGAMLSSRYLHGEALWFVPLLLVVVRPLSVWIGLLGSPTRTHQRHLIGWFGVRGVGSIYYLMFAIEHGLPHLYAEELTAMALSVIAVSLVVHGISVSPLMAWYERHIAVRHRRMAGPVRG